MLVNQASRSHLAGVVERLSDLAAYQLEFRHMSEAHPTTHIAKRFPSGFRQAACGLPFNYPNSVPAQDGAPLCARCERWFNLRV